MQELLLEIENVFLLERCPHFRGVLRKGSTVYSGTFDNRERVNNLPTIDKLFCQLPI